MGEARCCGRKMTYDEFEAHQAETTGPCAVLRAEAEFFVQKVGPGREFAARTAFWQVIEARRIKESADRRPRA